MSTSSASVVLAGSQTPRLARVPEAAGSLGSEAADLAASAGLELDPWQRWSLEAILGFRPDGRWSAFESGLLVPRQNGKGSVLEARELAGLFIFGERLILHSAHEFKTAAEAFRRIQTLIEGTSDLSRRVKTITTSHGEEGVELLPRFGGGRLRFVARTSGSGRGFTGDCVILDEAYALVPGNLSALMPTLSARPNPQIIYTSMAGTPLSFVLAKLRKRGIGGAPRVMLAEWSAAPPPAGVALAEWIARRELWAQANPGLGIRLQLDVIEAELAAMEAEDFARERLGIWADEDPAGQTIPEDWWRAACQAGAKPAAPLRFALDVLPDRSAAAIAVAGGGAVELVAHARGTGWIVPWICSRKRSRHVRRGEITIDAAGPAASIADALERRKVKIRRLAGGDVLAACARFLDDLEGGDLLVRPHAALDAAADGVAKRMVGDRFCWSRTDSTADVTPLMAATLAWAAAPKRARTYVH